MAANPRLVEQLKKRRGIAPVQRMPEMDIEAAAPKTVDVQVPPEFQAQEAELAKTQNLGQPSPEQVQEAQVALDQHEAQAGAQAPAMGAAPRDDEEMYAAQDADRQARNAGRMELAAKQFVAGMTQTPQASLSAAAPSQVPQAMERAKTRREQVAAELMRRRQATMDASTLDVQASEAEKNRRPPADKGGVDYTASREAALALDREKLDEQKRAALVREELARQKAARGGKGEPKLKPLTDSTITDLADTDTALRSLGDLGQQFVDLGQEGMGAKMSGKVSGALGLTSTDAGKYLAAAKLAMQGVGKIMEGGKLAAGDETKYMGMLPVPGDSYDSAARKISAAQAYLRGLRDDRVKALKAAGRDVPSFGEAGKQAVKYLVSPDKKRRVPVYADGTKGAEEANPNG